jgi:hypothetical protein
MHIRPQEELGTRLQARTSEKDADRSNPHAFTRTRGVRDMSGLLGTLIVPITNSPGATRNRTTRLDYWKDTALGKDPNRPG